MTDNERIDWLEKTKYFRVGINWNGAKFYPEIQFNAKGKYKSFIGKDLRAAIDAAVDADRSQAKS